MFSNFIDNIPKTTKKQEVLKAEHLESLKNKADKIKENFDKFDYFTHPVVGVDKHHSHVELPKKTQDILVDQEQNDFGERYFTMLTGKKKEDLDVKQVPKLNGIEEQKSDNKEESNKKNKFDTMTTIYIGSISIIGIYIAYRAIRKTI